VSEPVSGLEEVTTYHFAVCAEDGENPGDAFCSPDQTFRTTTTATSDSVTVTGNTAQELNIDLEASSGPSGENPTGHGSYDFGPSSDPIHFPVDTITCLSVNGDTATFGGTLQENDFGVPAFRVTVVDQGLADSGQDAFRAQGLATAPTDCSGQLDTIPLINGNAVVIDAPAPTTP
jgi:hypothetical protein